MEFEVTLYKSHTTPGTVVYKEAEDTPKEYKQIPSLYIRKTAMNDVFGGSDYWPDTLVVTVADGD